MIKVTIYDDGKHYEIKGDNVEEVLTVLAEIHPQPQPQAVNVDFSMFAFDPQQQGPMLIVVCPECEEHNDMVDEGYYVCKKCGTVYE